MLKKMLNINAAINIVNGGELNTMNLDVIFNGRSLTKIFLTLYSEELITGFMKFLF